MTETPTMWAHKDEAITCVQGHVICHLSQDIELGTARDGAHFCRWQQPEPEHAHSVAVIRCKECRGVWVRGTRDGGYQFHFADGWR